MASINLVNPDYFAAPRIPLLHGRAWTESENHSGAHVAVINRTLAQRYFPNGDAIGHSVKLPGFEDRPPSVLSAPGIADSWLPIVGIVGDARNDGLANPVTPAVFVPFTLNMMMGTGRMPRKVRSEMEDEECIQTIGELLNLSPAASRDWVAQLWVVTLEILHIPSLWARSRPWLTNSFVRSR